MIDIQTSRNEHQQLTQYIVNWRLSGFRKFCTFIKSNLYFEKYMLRNRQQTIYQPLAVILKKDQ